MRQPNKKGRTPLQRPAPNNQTNQPLTSDLLWMGKPKTHPASSPRLVISDSYFTQLFKSFFCLFCNRLQLRNAEVPVPPYFMGGLTRFGLRQKHLLFSNFSCLFGQILHAYRQS
jgi:hypothetical protein